MLETFDIGAPVTSPENNSVWESISSDLNGRPWQENNSASDQPIKESPSRNSNTQERSELKDPREAALNKVREHIKPEPNELREQARLDVRDDGSFETLRVFDDGRYEIAIFRPDGTRDNKMQLNSNDKSAIVTVYDKEGKVSADMTSDKNGHVRTCHGYEGGKLAVEFVIDANKVGKVVTYNTATRAKASVAYYKGVEANPIKHVPALGRVMNVK